MGNCGLLRRPVCHSLSPILETTIRCRPKPARCGAAPAHLPEKWVVDCKCVSSSQKVLVYLGRYLYRGVIQEKDIIAAALRLRDLTLFVRLLVVAPHTDGSIFISMPALRRTRRACSVCGAVSGYSTLGAGDGAPSKPSKRSSWIAAPTAVKWVCPLGSRIVARKLVGFSEVPISVRSAKMPTNESACALRTLRLLDAATRNPGS